VEAPLAGRVECKRRSESSGFLGLGPSIAVLQAVVHNDSPTGGLFTVVVKAGVEGQPESAAVPLEQREQFVAGGTSSTVEFRFSEGRLENLSVLCSVVRPTSVQQVTEICPTCAGRAVVAR
jgi:hypothetical protein